MGKLRQILINKLKTRIKIEIGSRFATFPALGFVSHPGRGCLRDFRIGGEGGGGDGDGEVKRASGDKAMVLSGTGLLEGGGGASRNGTGGWEEQGCGGGGTWRSGLVAGSKELRRGGGGTRMTDKGGGSRLKGIGCRGICTAASGGGLKRRLRRDGGR